jgi:hypothetical protein
MSTPPKEGKVFEGWLADAGGSDYKLSVGAFSKVGTLHFISAMVYPYTYTQFLIKEFFEDPDPNAVSYCFYSLLNIINPELGLELYPFL